MRNRVIAIFLLLALAAQAVPAQSKAPKASLPGQKAEEEPTDKRFWPLVAGSGILFVTGVVLFAMADQYEDDAHGGQLTDDEEDELIRKAAVFWPLAVTSIGTSTGLGILALKIRYEPKAGLALNQRPPALGLAWNYTF